MKKPIIFPKSRIGKNKFEETLKKDSQIKEKEIQLISIPGNGVHDISYNRQKGNVGKNTLKFERLLNERIKYSLLKNIKNLENRSQLLHTHIIKKNPKREEFGTALPSRSDISSFIEERKKSIKYQIISVINPKTRNPIGYTTIKINSNKITPNQFLEIINKHLTPQNTKNAEYKKYIFEMIESLGMEIYFTPENGYTLDNRFNYVKIK